MNTQEEITSMVFYESYMQAVHEAGLSPELRCEFYEGIMRYCFKRTAPQFTEPVLRGIFSAIKINLDNNLKKYDRHRIAVENGKKGGAPYGNKNACSRWKKTVEKQAKQPNETTISLSNSNSLPNSNSLSLNTSNPESEAIAEEYHEDNQLSVQERNALFYNSLIPYEEKYGKSHVYSFYCFWSELSQDRTQMRFEMQDSWDLESRLRRWKEK